MAESVPLSELRLDFALYPRTHVKAAHVGELADALSMGATLPPVIARRGTGQVIDGFHRVRAARERRADTIAVEWRDYESDAHAFEDALRLNATHGLRFRPLDRARAAERAAELGLAPAALSAVLKVPTDRLPTKRQTASVIKRAARPSGTARDEWRVADERHEASIGLALRDLADRVAAGRERGPGELPGLLLALHDRRKVGVPLREVLLEIAALCVWWAARDRQGTVAA